jgi:Fe-S-cluster-containing hydrogenase component 2
MPNHSDEERVLEASDLDLLVQRLRQNGLEVIAPVYRNQCIVLDEISSARELPVGWGDEQEGGTYRVKRRPENTYFGFNSPPHSWKQYLQLSRRRLYQAKRSAEGIDFITDRSPPSRMAFFGVRACDLAAIGVQDHVLRDGPYQDSDYSARRSNLFLVAVNCGQSSATCFCVSMNTGPTATSGYDLVMTEVITGDRHYFTVQAGSAEGREVLCNLPTTLARETEVAEAQQTVLNAASSQRRHLDTRGIKELFYQSYDSPIWNEVATRCLSCANCTMVCPTCFCTTVEDVTDLSGENTERWLRWDSCFTLDHSRLHTGPVRATTASRYRQWITHKLATWIDQFGESGCVGCGRCIAWCPVGIDITEEAAKLRALNPSSHDAQNPGTSSR